MGYCFSERGNVTEHVFLADLDSDADSDLVLAEPHVVSELDLVLRTHQEAGYPAGVAILREC